MSSAFSWVFFLLLSGVFSAYHQKDLNKLDIRLTHSSSIEQMILELYRQDGSFEYPIVVPRKFKFLLSLPVRTKQLLIFSKSEAG